MTSRVFCVTLASAACMGSFKSHPRTPVSETTERIGHSMFAIVETGGKQYRVSEGDIIFVEKLDLEEGSTYTFEKVLAIGDGEDFVAGTPTVEATVTANVVKNGKGKKIHIIRYKPKKDSKKHIGHRQPYTKLQIVSVAK